MKSLKWITNKEQTEYMAKMKALNISKCVTNENENLVWSKLSKGWTRQAVRGYRIHDFWNHELGCAIEVDGTEHDREYDNYRDEYNFRRSGVLVLRVRNRNMEDLDSVLATISKLTDVRTRKEKLGITGNTKQSRRTLSSLPYDKTKPMFLDFLVQEYHHYPYWYININRYN